MKVKIILCHSCGADRQFLIKADLTHQDGVNKSTYSFYRLCLNCFLGTINRQIGSSIQIPEEESRDLLKKVSDIMKETGNE